MLSIKNFLKGYLIIFILLALSLGGCGNGGGTGILKIRITDSPFPFGLINEANVTIDGVDVHISDSPTETSGFITLPFGPPRTFDLLSLQGGVTATLINASLPAGTYNQIRLLVNSGHVKLKDGRSFNLNVPSGDESGIKIFPKPFIVVQGGLTADLILDFDVSRSFIPIPNAPTKVEDIERFNFNPVIRVVNSSSVGSVSGKVYDNKGTSDDQTDDTLLEDAALTAFDGTTEVASTSSQSDGSYVLSGLPEGAYDIRATHPGYQDLTRTDVSVNVGNDTGGVDFRMDPAQ